MIDQENPLLSHPVVDTFMDELRHIDPHKLPDLIVPLSDNEFLIRVFDTDVLVINRPRNIARRDDGCWMFRGKLSDYHVVVLFYGVSGRPGVTATEEESSGNKSKPKYRRISYPRSIVPHPVHKGVYCEIPTRLNTRRLRNAFNRASL